MMFRRKRARGKRCPLTTLTPAVPSRSLSQGARAACMPRLIASSLGRRRQYAERHIVDARRADEGTCQPHHGNRAYGAPLSLAARARYGIARQECRGYGRSAAILGGRPGWQDAGGPSHGVPPSWAAIVLALLLLALVAGGCRLAHPAATPVPALTAAPQTPANVPTAAATPVARATASPSATPAPGPTPDLLARLDQNPMPPRDYVELVSSLQRGGQPVPRIVHATPIAYAIGDQARFYVGNMEVPRTSEITATLRVQTDHLQMWVEDGLLVSQQGLEHSAAVLEERIYPTNHRYFGSEWTPGVDGDARLVVLNTRFDGAVGYFTSANEYSRLVNPYSNEREMFFMNVEALAPGTDSYNAVLAHEFQHMIHWHQDSNEDTWVNEGASELAEQLNGYAWPRGFVQLFEANPDLQLNHWPDDPDQLGAHYGASYLFLRYFADRFGPEALRALLQHDANGIAGFDAVLQGRGVAFDDLFADWLVANLLDDPLLGAGEYGYREADVHVRPARRVETYPHEEAGQVRQYAADYFELMPDGAGNLRLAFAGAPTVRLVPNEPTSGRFQWWSNRGDVSHSTLERTFDLTGASEATLTFNLWYDIESGWDYAHVRVSTDGGQSWQLVRGAHMTDYDPTGNALGPGYTGMSGHPAEQIEGQPQWVRESLDLTPFCGQEVIVRFDYITDDTVHRAGLCLDDFELAAVGFADDVESGEDGWRAQGFMSHENVLPQRYTVQLVEYAAQPQGPQPRITRLPVGADGRGEWTIEGFGERVQRAYLIISAMTPYTTEPANYSLTLEQLPQPGD